MWFCFPFFLKLETCIQFHKSFKTPPISANITNRITEAFLSFNASITNNLKTPNQISYTFKFKHINPVDVAVRSIIGSNLNTQNLIDPDVPSNGF